MPKWIHKDCIRFLQDLSPTSQFLVIHARNLRSMFFPEHIIMLSKILSDLLLPKVQNTLHENQEPHLILWPHVLLLSHTTLRVSLPGLLVFFLGIPPFLTTVLSKFFLSFCAFSIYRMTSYSAKSTNIPILTWKLLHFCNQINSFSRLPYFVHTSMMALLPLVF